MFITSSLLIISSTKHGMVFQPSQPKILLSAWMLFSRSHLSSSEMLSTPCGVSTGARGRQGPLDRPGTSSRCFPGCRSKAAEGATSVHAIHRPHPMYTKGEVGLQVRGITASLAILWGGKRVGAVRSLRSADMVC